MPTDTRYSDAEVEAKAVILDRNTLRPEGSRTAAMLRALLADRAALLAEVRAWRAERIGGWPDSTVRLLDARAATDARLGADVTMNEANHAE